MKKALFAIAILTACQAGCKSDNPSAAVPTPSVIMDTSYIGSGSCEWSMRIYVDNMFTPAEASDIGLALANWSRASKGRICFAAYWMLLNPAHESRKWNTDGMRTLYSGTHPWEKKVSTKGSCSKPGSCAAVTIWEKNWNVGDVFYFNRRRRGFRTLTEHEIGHLLGLGHSSNRRDIMHVTVDPDFMHTITANDRERLECLMDTDQVGTRKNTCRPAERKSPREMP